MSSSVLDDFRQYKLEAINNDHDIGYYGYRTSMKVVKFSNFCLKVIRPIFLGSLLFSFLLFTFLLFAIGKVDIPGGIFSSFLLAPITGLTLFLSTIMINRRESKVSKEDENLFKSLRTIISLDIGALLEKDDCIFHVEDDIMNELRLVTHVMVVNISLKSEDARTGVSTFRSNKQGIWSKVK